MAYAPNTNDYYPYGMQMPGADGEMQRVQPYKFGGKEHLSAGGLNIHDFGPRALYAPAGQFASADPKCEDYPHLSPYLYCAANPVNAIDPTGCIIKGVTGNDANMVVEDIRAMFSGEEFESFRELIVRSGKKQNGKALAKISKEALDKAFDGISLSDDQQALVDITVNTINSNDVHRIEYSNYNDVLSEEGKEAFLPGINNSNLAIYLNKEILNGSVDLNTSVIAAYGGNGVTTKTASGYHTVIITDWDHSFGRAVTMGHELFGHGRSSACGYTSAKQQHEEAIVTENLIRRILGIEKVRDGSDHGDRTIIKNPTRLPSFR